MFWRVCLFQVHVKRTSTQTLFNSGKEWGAHFEKWADPIQRQQEHVVSLRMAPAKSPDSSQKCKAYTAYRISVVN
eukprot:4126532-Amphidinium_carterae.1